MPLVLNQYRVGSGYKDVVGVSYHYPIKYRKRFEVLPIPFVYYEPREGGDQVYFGAGVVSSVCVDTEEPAHYYADIVEYVEFEAPISFYKEGDSGTWELSSTMRNSVRDISESLYDSLCDEGGVKVSINSDQEGFDYVERLRHDLSKEKSRGRKLNPPKLRRIQRILYQFERPSSITNAVKRTRGSTCQICGYSGFQKKDGSNYCEVHHLFQLSSSPPDECLSAEYLIVVCANCHRQIHYGNASDPRPIQNGWAITIDGIEYSVETNPSY